MDILSSTLSHAAFDPAVSISAAVKTLSLLAAATSVLNVTWPENSPVKDGDHFDFIIVGAGTAGSVLGRRLTEVHDWRVLVIEYGSDPPVLSMIPGIWQVLTHGPQDWDFVTEVDENASQAQNGRHTIQTRGKVLGGTSSINHLLIQRGTKLDYDAWSQAGHAGWDWESVLKYFKKSEKMLDSKLTNGPTSKYHSCNGTLSIKPQTVNKMFKDKNARMLKNYENIGMNTIKDPLVPIPEGNGECYFSITDNNNRRASTAEEYLLPCKGRRNFYLLKEALATKIIINERKEAKGVSVTTKSGKVDVFADVEVILSAGVINSPQLLLLSGIGPKKDLENLHIPVIQDLPVGRNMQDHVFAPVVISGESNALSTADAGLSVTELGSFPAPLISGTFSSSIGSLDMQNISLSFGVLSPFLLLLLFVNFNFNLDVSKSLYLSDPEREKLYVFVALTKPKSRGRVTIRSTDPKDPPIIYNNYYTEEDDVKRMVEFIRKIVSVQETSYYTEAGGRFIRPPLPECDDLKFDSDDYWACYVKNLASTLFHTASTCSMGEVVDERLNVKGVKNLRVIDASVMPTIPSAATLWPTIMIAEKGADMIKEDYGKADGC